MPRFPGNARLGPPGVFFKLNALLTSHGDGQIRELPGQLLETLMSHQRFLQGRHLVGWDVAGVILALMPALKLVEGRGTGSPALSTKLAPFHTGDGVHFLKNLLATLLSCHG
jgi:hypothetical protein